MLQSGTTDGSSPKEHGGIYDSEIITTKDATHVLQLPSKWNISEVLTIKIDRTNRGNLVIDKQRPLKLYKSKKPMCETFKELGLLKKHQAQISDVFITLYKTDENNNDKGWIEISMDSSTRVDIDKLEDSIDNIRSNFMSEGRVNISLEYNTAIFESGQHFLDWVAENKKH